MCIPDGSSPQRKIIHIDMDCFFAAIEVRERPELRGQPVAVGGASARGVLTTCNYEAREYGCRSAMPTYRALRLCPQLIVLPVRFGLYGKESRRIRDILGRHADLLEPLSLDEAFLDVTASHLFAWEIARRIRREIRARTGLTASAGIAPNKMLAKIASDWRKPDGQFAITPERVGDFMRALPVRRIWGIGPKNAARLDDLGISICGQLQQLPLFELQRLFGRFGSELYDLCRGRDDRPVEPRRLRKSISTERTFSTDLKDLPSCLARAEILFRELESDLRLQASERPIAKAFVKVKFSDFRQTTRECTVEEPTFAEYRRLLSEAWGRSGRSVRLIGLGVRFRDVSVAAEWEQLEFAF